MPTFINFDIKKSVWNFSHDFSKKENNIGKNVPFSSGSTKCYKKEMQEKYVIFKHILLNVKEKTQNEKIRRKNVKEKKTK